MIFNDITFSSRKFKNVNLDKTFNMWLSIMPKTQIYDHTSSDIGPDTNKLHIKDGSITVVLNFMKIMTF